MSADPGSALPVRTSRYRRRGRHSSPHQLSLPSDSPALVIAVPGSATPETEETVARIADQAAGSCHGAEVLIGYLRGGVDHLEDVLDSLVGHGGSLAGVVVPLLPFPNAEADQLIADIVEAAEAPLLIADHLGPHPLLAEALHARLADVGLARAARAGRISIVTAADGVVVGAVGGEDAVQAAEVVAVLLASRLTTLVAAASLTDPGSIKDAAARLRQAVPNVALAPCLVGPELTSGTLEAIAALTSTECAPPLGSHPAVGQLVAIRYGAALAAPGVASMVAEAKGESLSAPARPAGSREAPSAGTREAPPAQPAGTREAPPAQPAGTREAPPAGNREAPPAPIPPAGNAEVTPEPAAPAQAAQEPAAPAQAAQGPVAPAEAAPEPAPPASTSAQ